jgi:DNA-binding NtrC family response regulator
MAHGTVVLAGNLPVERLALDLLAAEFGWSLKEACSLAQVVELNADHNLVAVLFSQRSLALSWEQALHAIQDAAPRALPILCHGFAEGIDWPQAARAGAFHALLLPFSVREVRHSLGFVFDAKSRPAIISVLHQSHREQPSRTISKVVPGSRELRLKMRGCAI